ncbi:MAG: cytochrome c biogenesis protein ResB [Deltaproteobacteria bacterium]|nr:cytochrome c biogenesis protein ResB [Deltaproteobacteria bacterium]
MKQFLKNFCLFLSSITLTVITLSSITLTVTAQIIASKLYAYKSWVWLEPVAGLDVFRSDFFTLLLLLFCINLVACCLKQSKRTIDLYNKPHQLSAETERSVLADAEALVLVDYNKAAALVDEWLTRQYRNITVQKEQNQQIFFAERGRHTQLGFYFAHVSILALVIGVIIGMQGYQYYIDIARGQLIDPLTVVDGNKKKVTLDFGLQCNEFKTLYYDNSTEVKKHVSMLSIIKNGGKHKTQQVDFGTPLQYGGIDIYQHRFTREIRHAQITVTLPTGDIHNVEIKNGQSFTLPGTMVTIRGVSFKTATLQLISLNPRSRLWLSRKTARFSEPRLQEYQFQLKKFVTKEMTNLRILHDPGQSIIWYSFLCMISGFSVMFFLSHDRLWVVVEKTEDGCTMKTAGISSKRRQAVQDDIAVLQDELQKMNS